MSIVVLHMMSSVRIFHFLKSGTQNLFPHQLRSKLLIKCKLDSLDVMTKLNCWSQL